MTFILIFLASCTSAPIQITLLSTQGFSLGSARLADSSEGTSIELVAHSLTPGAHGLHVHETGRCEAPDFATAGAHYNPEGREHGFNNPLGHHIGDLPNIEVGPDGTAQARILVPAKLSELRGRSLIIHAAADDYATDPSGNSGARIACAVIR